MLNKKISIICMLLSFAICVLSGCSGASDTDSLSTSEPSSVESVSAQNVVISKSDESQIKNSLSKTLNCMIKNDFNGDFHYLDMNGNIKEKLVENEVPRAVSEKVSYSISDIESDQDDTGNIFALVHINFKSVDMIELITKMDESGNYRQTIVNMLNNNEYSEKDFDIKVVMILHDNIWYLYETPALDDVFMGGLYSVKMAAGEQFFSEISKEEKADD